MRPSLSDAFTTTESTDPATISSPSAGVAKLMTGELFSTGGSGSGSGVGSTVSPEALAIADAYR